MKEDEGGEGGGGPGALIMGLICVEEDKSFGGGTGGTASGA